MDNVVLLRSRVSKSKQLQCVFGMHILYIINKYDQMEKQREDTQQAEKSTSSCCVAVTNAF